MGRKKTQPAPDAYDRHKKRNAERQRAQTLSGRDIGPIPDVADSARRERCRLDFRLFCETYFPITFHLPWSRDHLKVIARIEESVLRGGLFCLAMPRGSGKTSLCEAASIWASVYGHRRFVVVIGANAGAAVEVLESIKGEIETNEVLQADFPEVCHPVECLERIANRCRGQLSQGKPTCITWTAAKIVLPTTPSSISSGATIRAAGIEARLRGMKHKTTAGESVRPDFVLIDDPQTDETAFSPAECVKRERKLAGAILGLAGPGKKIAGLMPLTVIAPDDMAERMLNRKKHPEWNGEKTKLVYNFPANKELWAKYAELWHDGQEAGNGTADALAYYVANRQAMDAGAVIGWPERYNPDEVSAIQFAMNLKIMDEDAFNAEYQSTPTPPASEDHDALTADYIAGRMVKTSRRGVIPTGFNRLVAGVDVQGRLLYWTVAAFAEDFSGHVVAYGTIPDQGRRDFTLRACPKPLEILAPGAGLEAQLHAGLVHLAALLLSRTWETEGGAGLRIERLLIDENWEESRPVIRQWLRGSDFGATILPSTGRGITAGGTPMHEWQRRPGEKRGLNWLIPAPKAGEPRRVTFDASYWKSFLVTRFRVPPGAAGGLFLHGDRPAIHRQFADHLTAEYRVRTFGRGREVDEWQRYPNRENHWLDCLVMCLVGASVQGVSLKESKGAPKAQKRQYSFADKQARARGK